MKGGGREMRALTRLALTALLLLICGNAYGGDPSTVARILSAGYLERVPQAPEDLRLSSEEAALVQERFVREIAREFGRTVGYKAGLTNPSAQRRFGVDRPVRGVLLEGMLLESGAVLSARFGARPMAEGDLVVRVGCDGINDASTADEALACIDAVIPFIELPDLVFSRGVKLTAPMIVAVNVGARYGVLGEPLPLVQGEDWRRRLREFTVELLDPDGRKLTEGRGSDLMGDPLKVVLWIRDSLRAEGKSLRRGDLLSLGSITGLIPIREGMVLRAVYKGLSPDGPVEVRVGFTE